MKRTGTLSLFLILTCVLLAGCSSAASPSGISLPYRRHTRNIETPIIFEGRVVGVQDGDTITVLDSSNANHRIRLLGIDAPEKGQPFGSRSGENLSEAIFNRVVTIEWSKHDRYGRIVGKVVLGGQDICLEQIKMGMAWHGITSTIKTIKLETTGNCTLLLKLPHVRPTLDYGLIPILFHLGTFADNGRKFNAPSLKRAEA